MRTKLTTSGVLGGASAATGCGSACGVATGTGGGGAAGGAGGAGATAGLPGRSFAELSGTHLTLCAEVAAASPAKRLRNMTIPRYDSLPSMSAAAD